MICQPCRDGGDLMPQLRAAQALAATGRPSRLYTNQANGIGRRVNNHHGRCRGGSWCDCQHAGTPHHRRPAAQTH